MPPRKRQAPVQRGSDVSERRRSTRIGSGKKSDYFENDYDSDEIVEATSRPSKRARKANEPKSRGRRKVEEEDSEEDVYKEEEDEEDEEDDDDDDEGDSEKGRGTGRGKHKDDDDNDDDNEETDEDAPPKVTFTPHKQLRGLNGVEYSDNRVHPNTMLFLRDLKANNRRAWLKENDAEYRRSLGDWQSYIESLSERLIAEVDDTIPELPARDVIFRIYRDIRFSKDSTPYKPHFSAAWSRTGRKGPYACYYIHCEPGKCIVGGGLWSPEAASVQLLRASIDERSRRWRRLLAGTSSGRDADSSDADAFRREFLSPAKHGDESAAIKAFSKLNAENALKTKPKGFIADHRDIELLKLRNFTAGKKVPDSVFTDIDGQDKVISLLKALASFVAHLNRIVRPDPNGADDTDSDGSGDGEGSENDDSEDEDEDEES